METGVSETGQTKASISREQDKRVRDLCNGILLLKSRNKTIDLMLLVTDGTTWAIIQGTP